LADVPTTYPLHAQRQAVAKAGGALGHSDHGKTAAAHYVGAAATVPVLRVMAGRTTGAGPGARHGVMQVPVALQTWPFLQPVNGAGAATQSGSDAPQLQLQPFPVP